MSDDSIQASTAASRFLPTIMNQILQIRGRRRRQSAAPRPKSGRKTDPRSWNLWKGDRSCVSERRMTKL